MIKNTTEKTLIDALSYCSLRELPPLYDGENIWIAALALVAKRNGSQSYVILQKDKEGKEAIIKDFGQVSPIVEIKEIRPYSYLNSNFVPNFDSKKREDRIKWLEIHHPNRDFSDMTLKELNKEVINTAIMNQIKSNKEYNQYYE